MEQKPCNTCHYYRKREKRNQSWYVLTEPILSKTSLLFTQVNCISLDVASWDSEGWVVPAFVPGQQQQQQQQQKGKKQAENGGRETEGHNFLPFHISFLPVCPAFIVGLWERGGCQLYSIILLVKWTARPTSRQERNYEKGVYIVIRKNAEIFLITSPVHSLLNKWWLPFFPCKCDHL